MIEFNDEANVNIKGGTKEHINAGHTMRIIKPSVPQHWHQKSYLKVNKTHYSIIQTLDERGSPSVGLTSLRAKLTQRTAVGGEPYLCSVVFWTVPSSDRVQTETGPPAVVVDGCVDWLLDTGTVVPVSNATSAAGIIADPLSRSLVFSHHNRWQFRKFLSSGKVISN